MSFFKVPIDRLAKKLPPKYGFTEFNESQQAMIDGLNEKRFWVHISARRTGKSSAAAVLALAKLLEPDKQVVVVAPNFNLSSIIWDYVVQLIEEFGLETKKFNQKDHVIQLENGSTFRLLSAENRKSLVGRGAHLLIVDEAALIDSEEYFTRDLRPALSTYEDSRALFISTPRGKENYLFEYYMRGRDSSFPEWGSGLFTWRANPRLQEEDIEEARRTLPDAIFRQEYYCEWAVFEGQIYTIDEEKHYLDLTSAHAKYRIEPRDEKWTFIGGLDMGFRDLTVFVVIATNDEDYFVVDEYVTNESATSTIAENILELIDKWGIEISYIDSANQQTKADLAYDYDVYFDNAVKSVIDGISYIQTLIVNDRLYVDRNNAQESFRSLVGYKWSTKSEKAKPKHDQYSHACDAIRYAIYSYNKANAVSVYAA